ncbi:MAG: hypothetical protein DDT26_02726 [Dehalococcoidia bacterium]|nr:hypothetical protein [Chloroflexota bacterium]MBT9166350.1 hypothetical protein [Chloroflexota bacterium]
MDSLVLGIDAAWVPRNPSGIALVKIAAQHKPKLLRVARTCEEFTSGRKIDRSDWLTPPPAGEPINMREILDATERYTGMQPDVIVLDYPLSPRPTCGRRAADNAISRKYGSRWASTHSATPKQMGNLDLFGQLTKLGYQWLSAAEYKHSNRQIPCFLETYPHPVIIEMLKLEKRLCYKVAKRQRYWPNLSPDERWRNIVSELDRLHSALAGRISGFDDDDKVPQAGVILCNGPKSKEAALKGIEDVLDAVVCAWVGCEFLVGRAIPFGDKDSAIWIPQYGQKRSLLRLADSIN